MNAIAIGMFTECRCRSLVMNGKKSQATSLTVARHLQLPRLRRPLILALNFILWATVSATDSTTPRTTQLNVTGHANGTMTVAWTPLELTVYNLSYTFTDASNAIVSLHQFSLSNEVNITNAMLGATYDFHLQCHSVQDSTSSDWTCGQLQAVAMPSCPNGWHQHGTQCYYLSKDRKSWNASRSVCRSFGGQGKSPPASTPDAEISQLVADDTKAHGQALIWTVIDTCDPISPGDISKYNCCLALRSNSDTGSDVSSSSVDPFSTNTEFRKCTHDQELPFLCTREVNAVTVGAQNLTVHAMNNDSVVIAWSEARRDITRPAWNLTSRTVTVYDRNRTLVAVVLASTAQPRVVTPKLMQGETYNVLIWPHTMGSLMNGNGTIGTTFQLLKSACDCNSTVNDGALELPVAVSARSDWRGWVRVAWPAARRKKYPFNEYDATGYQIVYGFTGRPIEVYYRTNVSAIYRLFYIRHFHGGENVDIYLICFFGQTTAINCGSYKNLVHDASSYAVQIAPMRYYGYRTTIARDTQTLTWADAEKFCVARGGHLVSISGSAEDRNVSRIAPANVAFWTGAHRPPKCDIRWSDGMAWNFSNGMKDDPSRPRVRRCVQAVYDDTGASVWTNNYCNASLSYICKYTSTFVGFVLKVNATLIGPNTVKVKWISPCSQWTVSRFKYQVCKVGIAKCTASYRDTPTVLSPFVIEHLQPGAAYEITVMAVVDSLDGLTETDSDFVSIDPDREVRTAVSEDGQVTLSWCSFRAKDPSAIVYEVQSLDTGLQLWNGTTNSTQLSGLDVGHTYSWTLLVWNIKKQAMVDMTNFTFTTNPTCSSVEFQYGNKCYFAGRMRGTWDDGRETCEQFAGGQFASPESFEDIMFLRSQAVDMDIPFWVDGQTLTSMAPPTNGDVIRPLDSNNNSRARRDVVTTTAPMPLRKCRLISHFDCNLNRTVRMVPCYISMPIMCQRVLTVNIGSVSNVVLANVSSNWMQLTWSPPYWKPTTYLVTVTTEGATTRRRRDTDANVLLDGNSAKISALKQDTEYRVDITPVINGELGHTVTVEAATVDPNAPPLPSPQPLTEALDNLDKENVSTTAGSNVGDLRTFRLISCITIICLTSIAFVVFAACRMHKYRDCMSQLCFEVSIVIAHVLVVLEVDNRDLIDCKAVAIGIHFFFTAAFVFFALECFCHVKTMTKIMPIALLNKAGHYFVIGWVTPIVIILISTATISEDYYRKSQDHCWVNVDSKVALATTIPIGIFAALALLFLFLAICARPDENYEVDEESYIRYEPMQDIRWMLLFIWPLLLSHWATGMMAAHDRDGSLFLAFIVLTIVLAITILMLRCVGDDQVRYQVRSCCQSPAVGPDGEIIDKYMNAAYAKKGITSQQVPSGEGMLIVRKTYIFRP